MTDAMRRLASPAGWRILRVVADRGPVSTKVILRHAGIERSRMFVLLRDLRERGLVEDGGNGYEVVDDEVLQALRFDMDRAGWGDRDALATPARAARLATDAAPAAAGT